MAVINDNNTPVGYSYTDTEIRVSMVDGRTISAPLEWWPGLLDVLQSGAQAIIGSDSLLWPEWGGVDLEVMLLGLPNRPGGHFITTDQMAALVNIDRHTVEIILRADLKLPEEERRIPGAYKVGTRMRGTWQIPLASAMSFRRSNAGKKAVQRG